MGIIWLLIFLTLFVLIFVGAGFRIIQQAETQVIERLGRYHRTLSSGINIILPFLDRPRDIEWRFVLEREGKVIIRKEKVRKIDLRETVYDFPRQNVITRDNVVIEINALLYFQITDPMKAVYEVANLPDAIEKLTQTTLRNVIGEMDLDETLSSRETINGKLKAILDDATDKWGVKVNRVELQDIIPPADIRTAMEKQMRAERDRRAAILNAEGLKQSKILEAEGIREAEIKKAEGFKNAKILEAEGQAQARINVATAEAEAVTRVSRAVSGVNGNPIHYLVAVRYIETLREMVSGQGNKVIYLPYEASGVLSALGGIREMFTKE
jgi:regulator of protease activity HflC (stomatin/prohibitin superfamily)